MSRELGKVAAVRAIDVSPGTLDRSLGYHLSRIKRVARALGVVLHQGLRRERRLYLCIAGGSGVYYDLVLAAVARLLRYAVFVHHHSFTYVNQRDPRTAVLFALCGRRAVHICLCPTMAERLKSRYRHVVQAEILSNAALMEGARPRPARSGGESLTLGHFGNLTLAKGLDTVLDLFRRLRAAQLPVRLELAGTTGAEERQLIEQAQGEFGEALVYRGPLYGEQKAAYFAGLDAFLFPSRYLNEAQPLVLFEAMTAGVPVVATCRGCIGDDVNAAAGLVLDERRFADGAFALLQRWARDREARQAAASGAQERMEALRRAARSELGHIVGRIAGINLIEASMPQNRRESLSIERRHARS
jgi:glycosyltransferase involved in cell wall biosynthesis